MPDDAIIHLPHHVLQIHPQMSLRDRHTQVGYEYFKYLGIPDPCPEG